MSSATTDSTVLAVALAVELRQALTGLNEYIERRAVEVAAPLIAEAEVEAAARVAEMAATLQREQDVNAELRRILAVWDRRRAAATPLTPDDHEETDR